jgi:hypothetical protein
VGKDDWALFVGQWPAAFLLMGVGVEKVTVIGGGMAGRTW